MLAPTTDRLWASLPYGKDNARHGRYIAADLGLTGLQAGTAALRALVNEARREGYAVGSCREGYYRIANEAERQDTLAHLHARIAGMVAAIDGLRGASL